MSNDITKQLNDILNSNSSSGGSTDNNEDSEEQEVKELVPVQFENKESNTLINDNKDLNDDYIFARSNLYGLVTRANSALELALKIASMSEHPRAIEVAATLMKTSSDMTKDLLDLQRKIEKQEKSEKEGSPSVQNNTQNNYHIYKNDPKNVDSMLDELEDTDEVKTKE